MARETILVEQIISGFSANSDYDGLYTRSLDFGVDIERFTIEVDKTYTVMWDETGEHNVAPQDASAMLPEALLLGNGSKFELSGNNEPFAIRWTDSGIIIISLDSELESHKIAIYQGQNDGIVIKDPLGRSITYGEYDKILINRASGAKTIYSMGEAEGATVELDFSNGDMVVEPDDGKLWNEVNIVKPDTLVSENIAKDVEIAGITGSLQIPIPVETTVELDFSAGEMEVVPDEGKAFSKVGINKPETLIPENIADGVNIAGIIGALTASGGAVCKSGTFTGNGGALTFTHGLGVLPDVFIASITSSASPTVTRDSGLMYVGVSTAIKNLSGAQYAQFASRTYASTSARMEKDVNGIDKLSSVRIFRQFTETTVTIGGNYCQTASGVTYTWLAIGGLT